MSSHPCLPLLKTSDAARPPRSTGVTPLRRYHEPSRHRLVFSRFPGGCRLYDRAAPPIARWDEDGFSSCSTCPGHRAAPNHPAGVAGRLVSARPVMLPSPRPRGLGLRNQILSRPPLGSRVLRPGDSLTIPKMALSVGFIRFVSSTDATRATGFLTFTLVGLTPTEHVCIVWTHRVSKAPGRYNRDRQW